MDLDKSAWSYELRGSGGARVQADVMHSDDISCHLAMTGPLRRSGKLRMLLRDEFLTPLRYYK